MNYQIDTWIGKRGLPCEATVSCEWMTGFWLWKRHHRRVWHYQGQNRQWRNVITGERAEGDVLDLLEQTWHLKNRII